ncbi:transcription initiation factor TFIID subunit 9 [Parasteatoda tepidariorum]|uniref:transcription initiation factor TFIID subunit 9 n=1 Tax=Parasteatoda tepidariorum TaxID=114398 RepID=UPI00077F846E|nr:transcription initiation factor TFIID subunit 9 [Parasteatoda tepidariorum]
MAEAVDPTSSVGSVRSSPKDIQLMASILKEMGISDYEPRVLNQMLEFSYRYLTTILDDAFLYSTHAKKKCVDNEDVKLAISLYQERVMAAPPARDVILEVAKQRNSMPLPQIKSTAGLRLPPDRHSLTSCNYRLKSASKKRVHTVSRLSISNVTSNLGNKNSALINVNKAPSVLSKGNTNLSPAITKPVVSISKPVPTPIIKFSDGKGVTSSLFPTPPAVTTAINSLPQLLMPTIGINPATTTHILMPTIGVPTTVTNQLLMPSINITTASQQILMPNVGTTSASTPQINMPTVGTMNTEIKMPNDASAKGDMEEDDDYDME